MTATSPPGDGDSESNVQFVDQLIGPDVDAPEIKATLTEIASPIFDVLSGQKSGIAHTVEVGTVTTFEQPRTRSL